MQVFEIVTGRRFVTRRAANLDGSWTNTGCMAIRHVAVRWIPRDCPCVVPSILSQAVKRAYREATSEAPNWILIQVLLVAARMDNLEVAVDTARSLAPRLSEGDESNAPAWPSRARTRLPQRSRARLGGSERAALL